MMAWHYTIGSYLERILGGGMLVPATAGVEAPERPVVWFSLNQHWEPTATKGIFGNDGARRMATMEEMWALGDGLFRFGTPARSLLAGETLIRKARISRRTWADLGRSASKCGGDSRDWLGHIGALPIADMRMQLLRSVDGAWSDVPTTMEAIS